MALPRPGHPPRDTAGRVHHPGYRMPLAYQPAGALDPGAAGGDRYRLVLVERGSGILRLGRHRHAFTAPALLALAEGDRPALEGGRELAARAFYFHPSIVNAGLTFARARRGGPTLPGLATQDLHVLGPFHRPAAERAAPTPLGPGVARRLARLFDEAARELTTQPDGRWPCRSRTCFLEVLFLVERAVSAAAPSEAGALLGVREDVDPVLLHLATHYAERITIPQLTRLFRTNRTTLSRRFLEVTGLPVMAWLARLRVDMAGRLLRETTLSVAEIRERVGHADPSHFGRTFRRHAGCSPRAYRARHRGAGT